jgi:hypothetical protein
MQTTENLGLRKPETYEFYDVNDYNHNSDVVDALFEKDENGSVAAKNAKALDGHGADYFFPKSGGTVDGNLTVNTTEDTYRTINLKNATRALELALYGGGTFRLYDGTNNKNIISSTADGTNTFNGIASENLPIKGGTLKGFLDLKRSNDNVVGFGRIYQDNYTEKNFGLALRDYADSENFVGVRICHADDKIYYRAKDKVEKVVLHTGNKPSGSYTGNGDATARQINVGGVGETLRIANSVLGIAFVTKQGAHCIAEDGTLILPPSECKFENGTLTMATNASIVNGNGYNFYYELL